MEITDGIYEPLSLFKNQYREQHKKNVEDFFEELVKKSGVDEEENARTVSAIRQKEKEITSEEKKQGKQKGLKTFLTILTVIFFVAGIIFILNDALRPVPKISIAVGCFLGGIGWILLIVKKINKMLQKLQEAIRKKKEELKELLQSAWEQMRPLNNLYEWSMTAKLIQKTIPLVKLDAYFDRQKFIYMNKKYGLSDNADKDQSVLYVQSGEMNGNPFLLGRTLDMKMGQKTYNGSLTIHWTARRTVNGKTVTVAMSQVLHASVAKPYPFYFTNSFIIYANDAAPDLTFSRKPLGIGEMSDNKINKLVGKKAKQIEKMARVSVKKGGTFTAMANSEFEVLFNALNRDNEMQYRLLFTPLAQREIINLIKDRKEGYGDDWEFIKEKRLNFVIPEHLNSMDISPDPDRYVHYSLADSRKEFNNFNNAFFRGFYFSFAPILAIPLYQQYKSKETIYEEGFNCNVSNWEHEAIVNYMREDNFKHPNSITRNILKTNVTGSDKGYDEVSVTAYGFTGIDRVEYVNVFGGDGRYHRVPVPWVEYTPVDRTSSVVVKTADEMTRSEYLDKKDDKSWQQFIGNAARSDGNFIFRNSLFAFIAKSRYNNEVNNWFNNIISEKKNK